MHETWEVLGPARTDVSHFSFCVPIFSLSRDVFVCLFVCLFVFVLFVCLFVGLFFDSFLTP